MLVYTGLHRTDQTKTWIIIPDNLTHAHVEAHMQALTSKPPPGEWKLRGTGRVRTSRDTTCISSIEIVVWSFTSHHNIYISVLIIKNKPLRDGGIYFENLFLGVCCVCYDLSRCGFLLPAATGALFRCLHYKLLTEPFYAQPRHLTNATWKRRKCTFYALKHTHTHPIYNTNYFVLV